MVKATKKRHRLDRIDRRILTSLQRDATLSVAELAEQAGLSVTPCWRRIQNLEADGYILKRIAILDRHLLNASVTVFVAIRTTEHSLAWIEQFYKVVRDMEEVVDVYRMSGEVDYLLRAFVPDIHAYDALYKKLIAKMPASNITSMFAMQEIKSTSEIPLQFIEES
jgi:Lrp/AsnC family transcriptional regulator